MLTKTTILAVRALIYLAQGGQGFLVSPRRLAAELNESPTYMAKVFRLLVRAGILRAERGVKGGVSLIRRPADITFLSIYEATQGSLVGGYCRDDCDASVTCGYHHATADLHRAVVQVLVRWSLYDLALKPQALVPLPYGITCVMSGGKPSQVVDRTDPNPLSEVAR